MADRRGGRQQRRDRERLADGVQGRKVAALGIVREGLALAGRRRIRRGTHADRRLQRWALPLRRRASAPLEDEVAGQDHSIGVADRRGQRGVGIGLEGQLLQLGADGSVEVARLQPPGQPFQRRALVAGLRLADEHVERDRRGAGLVELAHEIGQHGA